jgi:hypothetical protein
MVWIALITKAARAGTVSAEYLELAKKFGRSSR